MIGNQVGDGGRGGWLGFCQPSSYLCLRCPAAASAVRACVALLSIMPIICGPILISSVSLPVAVLASAKPCAVSFACAVPSCGWSRRMWLPCSFCALRPGPLRPRQQARLPHSSALLRVPLGLAPCWLGSLTGACKFAFGRGTCNQCDVAPPAPSHRRRAPLQKQHVTLRQERD